jgi:hypothetical protein
VNHAAAVSSSAQALTVSRRELETVFSHLCNQTLGLSPSRTILCVRKGNKFVSLFCPYPNCGRLFWSPALSCFTHIHPVVTTLKLIVKTRSFGVSFGVLIMLTSLGFSLRYRHFWLLGYASCGCFVLTENLIKFKLQELSKVSLLKLTCQRKQTLFFCPTNYWRRNVSKGASWKMR